MGKTVVVSYLQVKECPLCGWEGESVGELNRGYYRFGDRVIHYPGSRIIPLKRCQGCGLVFKEMVPDRSDLLRLLGKWTPRSWRSNSASVETGFVRRFLPCEDGVDILDIGGSNGSALAPFGDEPGRRSVLEIVESAGIREMLSGEFILGFAEDNLTWSSVPYDVVLAFDLMEHLYDPKGAIDNIAQFVRKKGVFIVQTADAQIALLESQNRLDEWQYLNLIEHHIAWPYETLRTAMENKGFVPIFFEHGCHKQWHSAGFGKRKVVSFLKRFQKWHLMRKMSEVLFSVDPRQLSDPKKQDHMTVVFRRDHCLGSSAR